MPTWQQVRDVAAAQRRLRFEQLNDGPPTMRRAWVNGREVERETWPKIADGSDIVLGYHFADFDHPDPSGGTGTGARGESLRIAKRLCEIDTERDRITAREPTTASDKRIRDRDLSRLAAETDDLHGQLQATTGSWWPDNPPDPVSAAGVRPSAQTVPTAPGPAQRVIRPRH